MSAMEPHRFEEPEEPAHADQVDPVVPSVPTREQGWSKWAAEESPNEEDVAEEETAAARKAETTIMRGID